MTAAFPAGFEWGTATAAHQIEGANWNNDWWVWEHTPSSGCIEPSGDACDSWHRWDEDVRLCDELGMGSYRFSIEWSRIEPEEGEWSRAALDHYRRMGAALLEAGIDPVVTFHHFTTPRWLAARGGWADGHTVDAFARFCERAARALAPVMRRACTINEPNIVALHGFQTGVFPPGRREPAVRRRVGEHFCEAHRKAVDAIRTGAPDVPVGLTLSMADYQAVDGGDAKRAQIVRSMEDVFLDATEGDDFLGVQVYTRERVGPDGLVGNEDGVPVLPMGYEHWPQALEACLRRAWDYTEGEVPLLVTENGIGTDDDDQRIDYVSTALEGVLRCVDDGLDVRGYTYWSLLDNFEWAFGYGPRFGLVDVDRTTFARAPKPSAHWLAGVVKTNALPDVVERAVR
jgi:beta-glucosidase